MFCAVFLLQPVSLQPIRCSCKGVTIIGLIASSYRPGTALSLSLCVLTESTHVTLTDMHQLQHTYITLDLCYSRAGQTFKHSHVTAPRADIHTLVLKDVIFLIRQLDKQHRSTFQHCDSKITPITELQVLRVFCRLQEEGVGCWLQV